MLPFLLDFFFPRRSVGGKEGAWITEDERRQIRLTPLLLNKEALGKKGLKYVDTIVAAGSYDASPLLKKAILTFKYGRVKALGPQLGQWMSEAIRGLLIPPLRLKDVTPILCPVPLHWTRKFQRGFNQALVLAEEISKPTSWQVREIVKRTRPTGHQAWRSRAKRLTALTGAFASTERRGHAPQYVILIDDICTTGTTLDECAKALKDAGTDYVVAVVVAYG